MEALPHWYIHQAPVWDDNSLDFIKDSQNGHQRRGTSNMTLQLLRSNEKFPFNYQLHILLCSW